MKKMLMFTVIGLILVSLMACNPKESSESLLNKIFSSSLTQSEKVMLMKELKHRRMGGEKFQIGENTSEQFRPLSDGRKTEFISAVLEADLFDINELVFYHSFCVECFPQLSQSIVNIWQVMRTNYKSEEILFKPWFSVSIREEVERALASYDLTQLNTVRYKYIPLLVQATTNANDNQWAVIFNYCQQLRVTSNDTEFWQIAKTSMRTNSYESINSFLDYCKANKIQLDWRAIRKIDCQISYDLLWSLAHAGYKDFTDALVDSINSFERVQEVLNTSVPKDKVYKKALSLKEQFSISMWKKCYDYDKKLFQLLRQKRSGDSSLKAFIKYYNIN